MEYLVENGTRADEKIRIVVDFESFSKVLNRPGGFRDPGEPEEYCRGFQVFDKDMTGFIGVGQLRYSKFLVDPLHSDITISIFPDRYPYKLVETGV